MSQENQTLGFVGLGVMGEPICRNMLEKSGKTMLISDLSPDPIARLTAMGAKKADLQVIAQQADIIFLSLPGGPQVQQVAGQIIPHLKSGQILVDMSTAPVGLTRQLAQDAQARGAAYADAPVARTRYAAEAGTLAIMVGATDDVFAKIQPILGHV